MQKQLVVVTGGSGFIAIHIIRQLLQQGYAVRTTVRSLAKAPVIKEMLTNGGITDLSALEIVVADLAHDEHWSEAMAGATYAIDVASPTPKLDCLRVIGRCHNNSSILSQMLVITLYSS
ncbi:hypothetical protein WP50_23405 [Lactiplantibacillus plantarum]|nr:hypothetical protein WP50_23405 [Lactiplantibacillus plantarum]